MSDDSKPISFRMGEARDAGAIAHYYNMANNGLSEVWWASQAKPNQSWQDAFAEDILLEDSVAYFQRIVIAECEGRVVGILLAFPQEPLLPAEELKDLPSSELNIIELRRLAVDTLFIAVVAVDPAFRGFGIARHFVNLSLQVGATSGLTEASIIIHETNREWLSSFLRRGFTEKGRLPVGDHRIYAQDTYWVLLTCPIKKQENQKVSV